MCLSENGPDKKIPLIRHFFNSSTFSLHFIFCTLGFLCPGWPKKLSKHGKQVFPPGPLVWPCHALSLGGSSLTGYFWQIIEHLAPWILGCICVTKSKFLDLLLAVLGRSGIAHHLYGAAFSFPSYSWARIMLGMHKEYLAHIEMIYSHQKYLSM